MTVYTIPPNAPFLRTLARQIFAGAFGTPDAAELPFWTIYLPTRRAVPLFEDALLAESRNPALLLPQIRAIGDAEEDIDDPGIETPEPIATLGRSFILMDLIGGWQRENPQEPLAQEIAASPGRALDLAESLGTLADSLETGETTLDALPKLLDLELSRHREAIIGFLAILQQRLPARLERIGRAGPAWLRSRRIDRIAAKLEAAPPGFPVIAAGSTGTIPATARLLAAISALPNGAVVLPGLDQAMDEASWAVADDTHPQAAMKSLAAAMGVLRSDAQPLTDRSPRAWLAGEIMRPSGSAEGWSDVIRNRRADIAEGVDGVELVEAPQRRMEAAAIALVLRAALEDPARTAALITPDRDLARRVKNELQRWSIVADDTAGEPLIRSPQGSFIAALAAVLRGDSSAVELAALFAHPLLKTGRAALRHFEMAVMRGGHLRGGVYGLVESARAAQDGREPASHFHPAIRRLDEAQWQAIHEAAAAIEAAFRIEADGHLARIRAMVAALCDEPAFYAGEAGAEFSKLMAEFEENAEHLPAQTLPDFLDIFLNALRRRPLRSSRDAHPRLKIYGLLEARLVQADWIVLGGLNEGVWPGQPDPGPWLNRPMRKDLDMQLPERQIGLTAHDFAQAFAGGSRVFLTWSKRVDDAPALPSRWVLRLKMLLAGAGVALPTAPWMGWAEAMDEAPVAAPAGMPKPCPPLSARPRQFSVTDVEKLIRDPYGIYARKVLRLQKMDPLRQGADAALRGQMIHEVLNRFARRYPAAFPENGREELLAMGREVFQPFMAEPDVAGFWWPRFERIAEWFADYDRLLRDNVEAIHSEVMGELELPVEGEAYRLTARADRIDVLDDGSARIIDYKTGSVPSATQVNAGLAPQLTLEAAMLARGAFEGVEAAEIDAALYIKLSGAKVQGKETIYQKSELGALPEEHLSGFVRLLAGYSNPAQPYIPRALMEKEKGRSDYDHLSRFDEWAREGGDGE
jgi:ATP-dependent helicase/nuclease subunit B